MVTEFAYVVSGVEQPIGTPTCTPEISQQALKRIHTLIQSIYTTMHFSYIKWKRKFKLQKTGKCRTCGHLTISKEVVSGGTKCPNIHFQVNSAKCKIKYEENVTIDVQHESMRRYSMVRDVRKYPGAFGASGRH